MSHIFIIEHATFVKNGLVVHTENWSCDATHHIHMLKYILLVLPFYKKLKAALKETEKYFH